MKETENKNIRKFLLPLLENAFLVYRVSVAFFLIINVIIEIDDEYMCVFFVDVFEKQTDSDYVDDDDYYYK